MNFPKGKKKWIAIVAILALAVAGYFIFKPKASDISYKEARVERGSLDVTVTATGTVQPENRLEIKPPIAGRMETVLVSEGETVRRGQIIAWMSSTERAALLDAARSQGPDEIKKWEDLYRATPIIAPISGMIIARKVEPGQTFATSDAILVMSDRLIVKAQVDETDLAQIQLKQKALITLDAYSQEKIESKVEQIAFEAKTVSNVTTYTVDVLPDQVPSFMRSGMTASVTFLINSKDNVILIPSEAVKFQEGKAKVMAKVDGSSVEKDVSVGLSDGKKTEVLNGLSEGDTVLIPVVKSAGPSKNSNPFSPMGNRGSGRGR